MAKFIFIYKGPATDMSDMTEEQSAAVMEGWRKWIQNTGSALADIGAPMANSLSVVDDGSVGTAAELNGYSIVEADNMDEAKSLTQNHPFLSDGKGQFAIDIFELMPVPM